MTSARRTAAQTEVAAYDLIKTHFHWPDHNKHRALNLADSYGRPSVGDEFAKSDITDWIAPVIGIAEQGPRERRIA
jgi:hypothetical protein